MKGTGLRSAIYVMLLAVMLGCTIYVVLSSATSVKVDAAEVSVAGNGGGDTADAEVIAAIPARERLTEDGFAGGVAGIEAVQGEIASFVVQPSYLYNETQTVVSDTTPSAYATQAVTSAWNFGDGSEPLIGDFAETSSVVTSHVYLLPDTYTIIHTVTIRSGTSYETYSTSQDVVVHGLWRCFLPMILRTK